MGAGFNDALTINTGLVVGWPFSDRMAGNRYRAVSGSWNSGTGGVSDVLGTYTYNTSPAIGNAIEIDFPGTFVFLLARKGSTSGIISVYIDDILVESNIDLYSSTVKYDQVVFSKGGLSPTSHTLKITVTGKNASSSNYYVYLGALMVDATMTTGWLPLTRSYIEGSSTTLTVRVDPSASTTGFWNNVAVPAGGTSTTVSTSGARLRVLVNSSAATDITVQHSINSSAWYDGEVISFTGPGTKTLVVDCCYYVRLMSSQAATITAGYVYIRG